MVLSVVNAVPIGVLVLIVVVLVVGLTMLGVLLVRRFVPATKDGFEADVSSQLLSVIATLFGLLLAFVVVLTFQAYGDAGANTRQEAAGIAQIVRDSHAFSPADQAAVSTASGTYVRAVVYDEWPQLRNGGSSARAAAAVDDLYRAMQQVKPATAAASVFYQDAVERLNDVLSARRNRLADAAGGLSAPIVWLILLGSVIILGYASLVGSRSALFHAVSAGAIALLVGFSLVVLIAYNYPYAGSLAIGTSPYRSGILAQYFQPHP
jgi:ABC-type transport system involved in cytochrome bd biosynthesis fused ATPase/permease subunit